MQTCTWAVRRLEEVPGLRLEAASRWYRTAPVPASSQPDYVNGVVRMSGRVEPEALLGVLHEIEAEAGRVRGEPNAARVLDLDLLAVDGMVRAGPGLILPHPRLAERAFVLCPLCDVAPEWRHPVLGRSALELCRAAGGGGVAVLE
jgi:2-amino-4-hydroxy-6-hydroxymethyldihydropteridine diphosphokinase